MKTLRCLFLLFIILTGTPPLFAQNLTLDYYLEKGIANNPQLNDYRNQVSSSVYDSLKVKAGHKPQVNMLGQILVAPVAGNVGYDAAVTNTGNYELLMGVNQNIFNKKILAPQYESARLQSRSAANQGLATEHELRRNITAKYITAYGDLVQIAFAQNMLKLLQDESVYLKQLVEKGIYKPFDYSSFRLALQNQEIYLRQQEFQYRSDVYELNILCGLTDTLRPQLQAPAIQASLQTGFAGSHFRQGFVIDSLTIINHRLLTGVNYKPHLSWFADGGILGSQPALLYRNFGTSFGLNFSMPIYDGKQKKLEYKKLDLSENTRDAYQSYFRKQYNEQLNSLLDELEETNTLLNDTKKQLALSDELIQLGKNQLNIGTLPVTDFILAIRNYQEIKNTLNQLQVKQMQLTNELNYWNW